MNKCSVCGDDGAEFAILELDGRVGPEGAHATVQKILCAGCAEKAGYCKNCGQSMERIECYQCRGEGVDGHDCGEDCCCCADPEDNMPCQICDGEGFWWHCFNCYPQKVRDEAV